MSEPIKKCSSCRIIFPKVKSRYGEKGSVFNVPIGTKSEWEHNQGKWLKLCFDCWEKNKEQYKKMVDEGKIGGNGYHITNSDVEAHQVNEDDGKEYDPNSPAFEPYFFRTCDVVKCNVCSIWSTEPEVKENFHFSSVGIKEENTCSVKCGTIAKEKEELKDLEVTEKLTPQMLDENQKKRLKELKEKYSNNNPNRERESKNDTPTLLSTLNQLQQHFIANNIHSITNQNGNLAITFNQNQTNPNSPPPPPQTITDEELSETSTLMEPEQKSMWKKFKDYLKKSGKNKMDKQELVQEINKLKTQNEEQKPKETKIWPWIVGGIILILAITAILLIRNGRIRSKKHKT